MNSDAHGSQYRPLGWRIRRGAKPRQAQANVQRELSTAPGGEVLAIAEAADRENLMTLAAARDNGRRRPIEDQCYDNALGKQFRAVAAGRVGDLATKFFFLLIGIVFMITG